MPRISVLIAVRLSAAMIKNLRGYRSAHTPAKSEMMICGRKPARVEMVSIAPEWVVSVTYQMIAYWTSIEPNIERPWLDKNRAVFSFHRSSFPLSGWIVPEFLFIFISPNLEFWMPSVEVRPHPSLKRCEPQCLGA